MFLKLFKSMLVLILVLGLRTIGFTQEEKSTPNSPAQEVQASTQAPTGKADEPKEEISEKTLEGTIAGVSSTFIAIDYGQDEKTAYEITFKITKDTRLERIKNIKNLKPGDTVWVSYDEKVMKHGKESRVTDRILKVLRLLNAAKVIVEPEPVTPMVNSAVDNAEDNK